MSEEPQPSRARQRVLAAATTLFYEQGVRATGVDAVVAAAGVSKATVYAHFPSKDELVVAYLQECYRSWQEILTAHREQAHTPAQEVAATFEALAAWFDGAGYRGCASITTLMEFPDTDAAPRQTATEIQRAYREHFLALATHGASPTPEADADRLLALLDGSTVAAVALGARHPIDHAGQTAGELVNHWPHATTSHDAAGHETRR